MSELRLDLDRSCGRLADQVSDALRRAIRSGCLRPGDRLPSSRALALDLAISRGAVVEAYDQLAGEGFVDARRGAGTQVAAHALSTGDERSALVDAVVKATAIAPAAPPPALIDFDLRPGLPELGLFPRTAWQRAHRRATAEVTNADLGYAEPAGHPALRRQLSDHLRRSRGLLTPPAQVVVTAGGTQAVTAIAWALASSGHGTIAVENPTGLRVRQLLEAEGMVVVDVPVDDCGIDMDALVRTDARAVLVTPTHQYPTGVAMHDDRRARLVAWARETDAIIIEDDYDGELQYDRLPVSCLQPLAPDRVVLAGSVSKSLAPGLRLGWAVAPAELAGPIALNRALTDLGAPVLEQLALADLLETGTYVKHLRGIRHTYRGRRDALRRRLDTRVAAAPNTGLHLYLPLPGHDAENLRDACAAHGIAVDTATHPTRGTALVIGYGQLPDRHLDDAANRLTLAIEDSADQPS